ncbi:FAHD2 protein, partial [Amia calva]|nr:FAHD2 protein [Amia calva]
MRLVQFRRRGQEGAGAARVGVEQEGGTVVDLNALDPSLPHSMRALLDTGDRGLDIARRAVSSSQCVVPRSELVLLPPVSGPDKVVCVGMNYRDHCLEQFPSAITGPHDDITLPLESQEVDWEVELAFVIGRGGKNISEGAALSHVAGFMVANDVSARDWQMNRNGKQWLLGKTFDTFCPLGPALVTTDALSDPHSLGIRCRVNGSVVQDSNTSQMIFKTEALVAWVSKFVTLVPGDVFLTGTPPGVGVFRNPPVFLKSGDVVECEVDEIGVIRNTVV